MTTPATEPMTLETLDMADGRLFEEARSHEAFTLLRAAPGFHWTPAGETYKGFWSLARYDDVLYCSRHPEVFSSERGITPFEASDPEFETAGNAGNGKMLITMDPPRHVKVRRLVNKGFTPRAVSAWETEIRQITAELLDEFGA